MSTKQPTTIFKKALEYSVKRYPLASLFAVLFTFSSIFLNHYGYYLVMINIAYSLSLGFFLLTAFYHWRRNISVLIGGLLLIFVFWLLLSIGEYTHTVTITKYIISVTIALLLLVVLPFIEKKYSPLKFVAWILNILMALTGAIVFGLILFSSLAGAMSVATTLFEFRISGKYYMDLFIFIMGLFSTHFFLSLLAKEAHNINIAKEFYGRIGKFFVKYILTPITSIYAIVLVVYLLKIFFTLEWPNGILVWLSLVFALLSLTTYLFWTPFKSKYKKMLLIVALAQMGMLFFAIYIRVSEYGWSSSRYLVTMLGIWFVVTFLYLIISKNIRYELPFALLIIFLFISQYGWKLSAYDISNQSQTNRFLKLLKDNSNVSDTSPNKIKCELSRSIEYFWHTYNDEQFNKMMLNIIKNNDYHYKTPQDSLMDFTTKALGFKYISQWSCQHKKFDTTRVKIIFKSNYENKYLDISGYDILYLRPNNHIRTRNRDGKKINLIIVKDDEKILGEFDIAPLLKKLMSRESDYQHLLEKEELTFIAENDTIAIKVYFEYLEVYEETQEVYNSRARLLMRKK